MGNYAELVLGKFTLSRFIEEQGKKDVTASPIERLKISRQKHTASLMELVGGAEDNLLSFALFFPSF